MATTKLKELILEYHYEDGDVGAYFADDMQDLNETISDGFEDYLDLIEVVIRRATPEELRQK